MKLKICKGSINLSDLKQIHLVLCKHYQRTILIASL